MACNLSTFHVLVLFPGSLLAYNQISGELTQVLCVWHPGVFGSKDQHNVPSDSMLLQSPAAGFVRDTAIDALWIFTDDGQLARVVSSDEEKRVAYRAAKTVGRFDLAMALAPMVSGSDGAQIVGFSRSREAVLEAQADHAAASGDWDAAARLYAKTNRPIESVLVEIVEACTREIGDGGNDGGDLDSFSADLSDSSSKLMIAYLVCKLDTIPESKPSQLLISTGRSREDCIQQPRRDA
jgi:hypothetical protein